MCDTNICVVGLGYVGLPLANKLSEKFDVVGYDNDEERVHELTQGLDRTNELSASALEKTKIQFTTDMSECENCSFYIVTVPTPIDDSLKPDLTHVTSVCHSLKGLLKKGDIVVFESTVFPGATEEYCVPILQESGLRYNEEFFVGYSPERINPGDKVNTINTICKIISASCPSALSRIELVYKELNNSEIYVASSIKVAEAAKVMENAQRDINIAFMNEMSKIFHSLGLNTTEVLQAARTKWNFLPFHPGFVGGHCIGVDPYYLTFKAKEVGIFPQLMLTAREVNEGLKGRVKQEILKSIINSKYGSVPKLLFMGATFKPNVPDFRNSKILELVDELVEFNFEIDVVDPYFTSKMSKNNITYQSQLTDKCCYNLVILSCPHSEYVELGCAHIQDLISDGGAFFDLYDALNSDFSDFSL